MSGLAVPTPYTAVTGNFLTGSLWNAQVRDAVSFLIDPPRFSGMCTTAPTLTSGTSYGSITLDTEQYDTEGGHSTTSNTSRYVAAYAGLYQVVYSASFAGNATGFRSARITVNGSSITAPGAVVEIPASGSGNSLVICSTTYTYLGVGDYAEIQVWQNSGGNLNLNSTNTGMSCTWYAKS
jgi:hypothetical protein